MKILFVAMSNSIHTTRWINQITDQGWEIYLFPSDIFELPNENIKGVRIFNSRLLKYFIKVLKRENNNNNNSIDQNLLSNQNFSFYAFSKKIFDKLFPNYYVRKLIRTIKKIKPDIIHSLHIQKGGYLVLNAKKNFSRAFPKWVVSNWGSELTLFSFIKSHDKLIKDVLKNCDYFFCECKRDIFIARKLGFKGKTLPVLPNSGGIDFNDAQKFMNNRPPSERKSIIVKGYQGWAGRALVGLRALERCKDLLDNFNVYIYSVDTVEVKIYAELMREKEGMETIIIPVNTPREELLEYFAKSRIYIGLSIADAISTSLLEAMLTGAFPIQSNTSCASEWIKDGETGILVPAEDVEVIEAAIRQALSEGDLVNKAALSNYALLLDKIEYSKVKKLVIDMYKEILEM